MYKVNEPRTSRLQRILLIGAAIFIGTLIGLSAGSYAVYRDIQASVPTPVQQYNADCLRVMAIGCQLIP